MKSHSRKTAYLAIGAAIAATGGALAILCSDAIASGHWTLDHALLPVIVGITILAGHLVSEAGFRRPVHAAGFVLLFVIGFGLTVYTSVGRQAAVADKANADAEAINRELAEKQTERKDAKARWEAADAQAVKESTGQKCLERCTAWRKRADDIQARIDILDAGIKRLGGGQVVAGRADRAAEVLAVVGYDKKTAKRLFVTFEPFAYSIFLELAAIVALGFGLSVLRSIPRPVVVTPEPGPAATETTPGGQERRAVVVSIIAARTAREGRQPTLADIQALHLQRFGSKLPKSTASRWRLEAAAQPKRLRVVG